jgi:ribonuclease PH
MSVTTTTTAARLHDRAPDALRPVSIQLGVMKFAEGSALIELGDTRVLTSASVERKVPKFLDDAQSGWLTAEYSMLPRATHSRAARDITRGRPSGRSAEIQRLIGRSLRAVVDLKAMPGFTITVDCDVLQADGGTRTASITAGYAALVQALSQLLLAGDLERWPVTDSLAAVSVGIIGGEARLDLDYAEDSGAQVDFNLVATGSGRLVEIQGTGESRSFSRLELDAMLDLGFAGVAALLAKQDEVLAAVRRDVESVKSHGRRRQAAPKSESELWGKPQRG